MYILGQNWADGYLDYHLPPGDVRIATRAWCVLESLDDVYLAQPKSLLRVWNYLRVAGVRMVLRKIRSRLAESLRDRRVLAIGLGEIVEGGQSEGYEENSPVVFIAPCHPECVERLVLPTACVERVSPAEYERFHCPSGIRFFDRYDRESLPDRAALAGWNRFAGVDVCPSAPAMLEFARRAFEQLDPADARMLPLPQPTPVAERYRPAPDLRPAPDPRPAQQPKRRLRATVFGLGHYAKTNLIPNLDPRIQVACIHEIDPTQIGQNHNRAIAYDTCEHLREEEQDHDIYLIAGYHHTHADLAARALKRGAYALVEKPLVTTPEQLSDLLAVVREHPGRLFTCFQKRYNPLWELARQDLHLEAGAPAHCHAIVFEVPLPRNHWYNWPNSGSRLISNGCHWLDHFLFMNDYAAPVRHDLWIGSNKDLHVSVELENGAVFGMCLTDMGSPRLGVRDHVELRAGSVTVTVDNDSNYVAENEHRILRRKRVNRFNTYRRMYRTISRKILSGQPGDSLKSLQTGGELMLELEEMYQRPSTAFAIS